LNYIQGVNRYVFYFLYNSAGGGGVVNAGCNIINCPLNILDTITATNTCNMYSVPSIGLADQILNCPYESSPNSIGSNITLSLAGIAGVYQWKIVISLTPESG
jgi:hypothetical protein